MASASLAILQYMLTLCWTCLSLTPDKLKNSTFDIVLPTLEVLTSILNKSPVTFAHGLLDVLQCDTPPSVRYFISLPSKCKKLWAVYIIVLFKSGFRPKIYIGSSSNTETGVHKRFGQYDTKTNLPVGVARALNDGYHIAHKGLLCWISIPTPKFRLGIRAVIKVLECVLALKLWAMQSRTEDYGMPKLCEWKITALEYDGCCTHLPLYEGISGVEEGLTSDQLADLQVEKAAKATEYMRVEQGKLRRRPNTLNNTS